MRTVWDVFMPFPDQLNFEIKKNGFFRARQDLFPFAIAQWISTWAAEQHSTWQSQEVFFINPNFIFTAFRSEIYLKIQLPLKEEPLLYVKALFSDIWYVFRFAFLVLFSLGTAVLYILQNPKIPVVVLVLQCVIFSLSSQAAWAKRVSLCAILLGDNYLFTFLFLC